MQKTMLVLDSSYYPHKFKSFQVTKEDANGNPINTIFYKNKLFVDPLYMWVKEFNSDDKLISWSINML